MTPENFVQQFHAALGDRLKSVVLYGSAATGDFIEGVSGYNLLVVADPLGTSELSSIAAAALEWEKAGHPLPQFFTPAELAGSADAFPIEILDMQRSHKVLFGVDLLDGLIVDNGHLRMELEHDLKSKLLFFRQRYLAACNQPERLARLLVSSLATFLVLFRAALTLYHKEVPAEKGAALQALAKRLSFDPEPFVSAMQLKTRQKSPGEFDLQSLASRYLATIERIVKTIDEHLHQEPQ